MFVLDEYLKMILKQSNKPTSCQKIICDNCKSEIIQYYDYLYNGFRGRCCICTTNFPLD